MNVQFKHGNATLEELERSNWGEPAYQSHLVTECHRLRRVQLRLLTIENLRILIGQHIGLPFLMPFAIERLQHSPLSEGDLYPGDLLCAVLRVKAEFWESHGQAHSDVAVIAERARELAASEGKVVLRALADAVEVFTSVGSAEADNAVKKRHAKRSRPPREH
jgi:CDI immunity proteins